MPSPATWMDFEITNLNKVSQKDKYIEVTYMRSLKYDTNEPICKNETHSHHKEQTSGCQGWGGLGGAWSGMLGLTDTNYYIENE